MRLAAPILSLTALALYGQTTPPNLPAVNIATNAVQTCTFESIDESGGLSTQCRLTADGTVVYNSVTVASTDGDIVGHGSIMCLYWKEAAGKNRLQCGDGAKSLFDGYIPTNARSRRWFLFWK